jgi:CubicO group peptidase (beta-lactamase class C family)
MLLAGGEVNGRQLLSTASVKQMLTHQTTDAQGQAARLFLEGQGWGFGGSVDVTPTKPWNVPGRYGCVGGTGTSAHIIPSTGTVTAGAHPVATRLLAQLGGVLTEASTRAGPASSGQGTAADLHLRPGRYGRIAVHLPMCSSWSR